MRHVHALGLALGALSGIASAQVSGNGAAGPVRSHGLAEPALKPVFVENRGQFQAAVKFRTLLPSVTATITDQGLVLAQIGRRTAHDGGELIGHNVRLKFGGLQIAPRGLEPAVTRASYFLGNDAARWVTDVPCWQSVVLDAVAPGISIEIHGRNGLVEYDLLVQGDAAVETALVIIEGADSLRLLPDGSLEIATPLGSIRQLPPAAWEVEPNGGRRSVTTHIELMGDDRFRFRVDGRVPHRPLIIDPGLWYGTFVEGSGTEEGDRIAADAEGAAYIAGQTTSEDFPVTPGGFRPTEVPIFNDDMVVFKLSPDGSALEYSTFLGGHGSDSPRNITVAANGTLLICGRTNAPDYPTTPGAYSQVIGGTDGFVTKLNATGTDLLFSTFFGGSSPGEHSFTDLAVDGQGRLVLSGATEFADLPITPGAPQAQLPAPPGGFVARMSPDGSSIDYCTYVGCTVVSGVAVDSSSAIYATGFVGSSAEGLPVTPAAFQAALAGPNDAFALKLDASGALQWCTYLGGSGDDRAVGTEVGADGRPIVAGWTLSSNFPTTPGSFDPTPNGNNDDFITKIAADGGSLVWGTRLGGSGHDALTGLAIDAAGACYVSSNTWSPNMPVTPDAFDLTLNRNIDAHVAKLSADGTKLIYGTFLGSSTGNVDDLRGIAIDPQGNAYVTGYTSGTDYPVTPGAYDTELSGFSAIYVVKIDLSTWHDVGGGLADSFGMTPRLTANGSLLPSTPGSLHVDKAQPSALCTLILGLSPLSLPFKGGEMVPLPQWLFPFVLNAQGKLDLAWPSWPPGVPAGTALWFQAWVSDVNSVAGFTATNGLTVTVPTQVP